MSDGPPRSPSGLWRSTGASSDLFDATRAKLAADLAAKNALYRWDLATDALEIIVRLAMQSCANVAFELRQAWTNAGATAADHEAITAKVPAPIVGEKL